MTTAPEPITTPHDDGAAFPLLADPASYRPCIWDLSQDADKRRYWLDLFRSHFPKLLREAEKEAASRGQGIDTQANAASTAFNAFLDSLAAGPLSGMLTILQICYERERILRSVGIADPYRLAKQAENEQALAKLPAVLAALDAIPEQDLPLAVLRGVFAGNIYDLGATKTIDMFTDERVDFDAVCARLKPRPWRIDDADAWLDRLQDPARPPYRCACLFVDNAGPDICLGMLPLARFLLGRGTDVILTANTEPSLNDVTHDELNTLLDRARQIDPALDHALRDGRLVTVPSGNWVPLIDLTRVSPALARAVTERGVDLVVLEGMGRGLESNLDARLGCDCLKLAMVKDLGVAESLGDAELFDLVMKYEPAPQ